MNRLDEIKIDIIRRVVNMSSEKKLQQLLDIVKQERVSGIKTPQSAWPVYEGFGLKYTCGQWADISGLHRNTFRRYLQQGLTVEEIFEKRHCDPPIK